MRENNISAGTFGDADIDDCAENFPGQNGYAEMRVPWKFGAPFSLNLEAHQELAILQKSKYGLSTLVLQVGDHSGSRNTHSSGTDIKSLGGETYILALCG